MFLHRALMVRPVLKVSVDLVEQREKLAPLEPLDLLDSLDLLLVPFISDINISALQI